MIDVTVINYGAGNLFSVVSAVEHCGGKVRLTSSPADVERAGHLVLPGVGAFADGMDFLQKHGLIEPLQRHAENGKPFLGICLGMQMLFESSEEFGQCQGLGVVSGKVVPIPATGTDGSPNRIPHVGWSELLPSGMNGEAKWDDPILRDVRTGSAVYFAHSLHAECVNTPFDVANCDYNGRIIPAIIRNGNAYGCQFHPEKSGPVGLQLIRNFLSIGD